MLALRNTVGGTWVRYQREGQPAGCMPAFVRPCIAAPLPSVHWCRSSLTCLLMQYAVVMTRPSAASVQESDDGNGHVYSGLPMV